MKVERAALRFDSAHEQSSRVAVSALGAVNRRAARPSTTAGFEVRGWLVLLHLK